MESPSRNPLLLNQHDNIDSDDESNNEEVAGANIPNGDFANQAAVKETYRRTSSTPTDRYNFAYIAFYILGM